MLYALITYNGLRTTDEQSLFLICQTIQIVFLAVAAKIAENLVVDGVGFGGYLVGGDFLISLSSQKDDLVIWLNLRDFGDVHCDQTH